VKHDEAAFSVGDWIDGIEDRVDALLATPPQQFTAARNAAAKELQAGGRRDAAAEIKRLPRPPVSLWALNRLAHEQPAVIESYLEAAEALRAAHRSGGDIRAATPPQREAESRVVAAAGELARTHGQSVTETVVRGLDEVVTAAAADAGVATALRTGRLIREPVALSLDELVWSLPQAPARPARRSAKADAQAPDRTAERRALQRRIDEAEADASRARGHAGQASAEAEVAKRAWQLAEEAAAEARQAAEAAERVVGELRRELDAVEAASGRA
jgi:hypothetical protein